MDQNYNVVNIVNRGQVDTRWLHRIEDLCSQISQGTDRLAENYNLKNMDLEGHLTFDALVDDNEKILSFGGIYNGGRFPKGVYRILNRIWISPELRVSHGHFSRLISKVILPIQVQKHANELKLLFVSRGRVQGRRFLANWMRKQNPSENWQLSKDLIQVVPGVENKKCYQYICFRQLQEVQWNPKTTSLEQWNLLPED